MIPKIDNDPNRQWTTDPAGNAVLRGLTKSETDELVGLCDRYEREEPLEKVELSRMRELKDKHLLAHNRLYGETKQSRASTKH
jgi:hypothetical protein